MPEIINFYKPHPLIFAATTGDDAKVVELLKNGSDPNDQDDNHRTALMWCAHYGKLDLVKLLLDKGADPNAVDNKGSSVLWWANAGQLSNVVANNHEVIQILKRKGAKYMSSAQAAGPQLD